MTNSRNRAIAALIALVTACAGMLVTAPPAQAAEATFKILSANLGSGSDNDLNGNGVYDGHNSNEDPFDAVKARILAYNPPAVVLQEVCAEDVARFVNELNAADSRTWRASTFARMTIAQHGTQYANACEKMRGRPMEKGNVMLTSASITGQWAIDLDYHDGRYITLACMEIAWGAKWPNVCNTHLTAGDDLADNQHRLQQANAIVNGGTFNTVPTYPGEAPGPAINFAGLNSDQTVKPLAFGGDFNEAPKTSVIDYFHRINRDGTGINNGSWFWEADMEDMHVSGGGRQPCNTSYGFCRDGQKTTNTKKRDYVFFGKNYSKDKSSVNGWLDPTPTSAHDILVAKQTFEW